MRRYRAWIKEDEKMLWVCGTTSMVNLETDSVEINSVQCAERRSDGWVHGGEHEIDDVILMHSTGLFDKNGKEIFGGDIISFPSGTSKPVKTKVIVDGVACVAYKPDPNNVGIVNDEGYAFYIGTESMATYYGVLSGSVNLKYFNIEVIGNIYENKDLLKNA